MKDALKHQLPAMQAVVLISTPSYSSPLLSALDYEYVVMPV
jgi:hypothetical protein